MLLMWVSKLTNIIGENHVYEEQYLNGEIELNLIPQGSLAEKMRASASGIGGFYAKAGVGTVVEHGGLPVRLTEGGKDVAKMTEAKETREFGGIKYVLEDTLHMDFSIVKAYQGDKKGNLRFRKTARNFNPDMAGSGNITIAEVEEIVDEIPPNQIHVPGLLVDRIVQGDKTLKKIERLRIDRGGGIDMPYDDQRKGVRLTIINRAMKELTEG